MTANQWHMGKQFSFCISYMWLVLLLWKLCCGFVSQPRVNISPQDAKNTAISNTLRLAPHTSLPHTDSKCSKHFTTGVNHFPSSQRLQCIVKSFLQKYIWIGPPVEQLEFRDIRSVLFSLQCFVSLQDKTLQYTKCL